AVVASDIPAFQAVGDHGRAASLFANHDAANLALKVNGLLSQPAEIRELAARGQDRSQMYDWNTVASRVEQVYHTATLKGRKVTCSRSRSRPGSSYLLPYSLFFWWSACCPISPPPGSTACTSALIAPGSLWTARYMLARC